MKKIVLMAISLILVLIIGTNSAVMAAAYSVEQNEDIVDETGYLDEASEESYDSQEIVDEIESERTEYSKTFLLENGSKLLAEYNVPVHYKDDQGEWTDYDNTLKADSKTIISKQETVETISVERITAAEEIKETIQPTDYNLADEVSSAIETPSEEQGSLDITYSEEAPASIQDSALPNGEADNALSVNTNETAAVSEETKEISVLTNSNSDLKMSFAQRTSDDNMVFIGEGAKSVSWGYKDINSNIVAKNNSDTTEYTGNERFTALKNLVSTVKYESAYQNTDIELFSTSLGIKENIILRDKDAENSFVSEYSIGTLKPKQLSNRVIALFNDNDEVEYYINAEYMSDAEGKESYDLMLNILDISEGKMTVELTADLEWLQNSERVYPVTVDPSFVKGQEWTAVQCTFIDSAEPNTAYGYGSTSGYTGTIYSGTYPGDGMNRSFIKMNNLPTLNKGDMIIDVKLHLFLYNGYENSTGFYADEYVGLYEVKENWNQSTLTWNNRPNFYSPLIDYVKFDASSQPGWVNMNITKAFKGWFEGTRNNYGIMLKSVDEDHCNQCAAFFSSNYPSSVTPRPAFEITYRNNKGIENYWSNTVVNVGSAGTLYVNDYSGALTFITGIASTASPVKTASVNYVYNSYMAGEKLTSYTPYVGRGWRLNIYQTLFPSSRYGLTGDNAERYPYVYTDSDGTEHYFRKVEEDGTNTIKYLDEDGLNYELTIKGSSDWSDTTLESDDYYVITDKDKNCLTFFSDGLLRTQKNNYNQKTQLRYYDRNGVKWIEDPSGNRIDLQSRNENSYITAFKDASLRSTQIEYATFGNTTACLKKIKYSDNTNVEFTYYDNGLLKTIKDIAGYSIKIIYDNTSTGKVVELEEYDINGNPGNKITFDRTQYNTTIMQSSGNDGIWDSSDDIISTYQFDNFGRTKSVQTKTKEKQYLGASNYEYTSGTPNSSASNIEKLNRISANHSLGANTYNYISNHSFETSSGWTSAAWLGSSTFTGSNTTEQKLYGQKSYKIDVTSSNAHSAGRAYFDVGRLEANEKYTLSAYVKVTAFNGNLSDSGAVIAATSFNNDSTTPDFYSDSISEITDTEINNGWRRVSVTFTVPENSDSIRANIALKSATGTAYFDGIQLEKAETAGSYNLLQNSSFESCVSNTRPSYWTDYTGMTFSSSTANDGCRTTTSIHGTSSFKINGDVTANKYISQTVSVSGTEEDTYIVSGWAKADSVTIDDNNIRKFKISIAVHYSDGTQVYKDSADFNPTISDWQFVSKAFNLSDGTSANKTPTSVEIFMNYSKQGNAAYFDNISLVKEPSQSYTYDSEGNLISVVANAQQNSSMEYNTDNKLTKILDPKGYSYEYTYNTNGSVETAKTQNNAVFTYTYDDFGNVEKAVGVGTDGVRVRSKQEISYPTSSSTEYTVTSHDQLDRTSTSVYNAKTGALKQSTDRRNVPTKYTYNTTNDLLTSVSKELCSIDQVGDAGNNISTVNYSYDNYHKLIGIDTNYTSYSFEYNEFGEKTKTKVGNRTLATYSYNNGGLLTRMDYGNGDFVTYDYDKFGNTNKKYQNGTLTYEGIADNTGAVTRAIDHSNNLQYDYTYDSTDRLVASSITDATTHQRKAMFEYNFDLNNNLSKFTTLSPSGHNKTEYTYGNDNLLTAVSLDNSKTLNFTYDGIGHLRKHTLDLQTPLSTAYTYHGIVDASENDTVYKSNLVRDDTVGTGNVTLDENGNYQIQNKDFAYRYHYDANDNIIRLYNTLESEDVPAEEYTYDSLGMLEEVRYNDRGIKVTYFYDECGNIIFESISDLSGHNPSINQTIYYSYDDTDMGDLLTEYDGDTITYDAIGNPLQYRDGISFTWANGRQLQSYTKDNNTISYTYDSGGMRLTKDVGNTHYTYLYKNGLLVQETIGEKVLDYSYSAGGSILSVRYKADANPNTEAVYYYYALNSRGDVIGLYDSTGSLYAKYTYDVWGNPVSVTNASGVEISDPTDFANIQPLRYRSYYYDSDTGFYYLQSRYYDPVTHRFINADSQLNTDTSLLGYNLFAYCENNPVCNSDHDGHRYDEYCGGGYYGGSANGLFSSGNVNGRSAALLGVGAGLTLLASSIARQEQIAYKWYSITSAKEEEKEQVVVRTRNKNDDSQYWEAKLVDKKVEIGAPLTLGEALFRVKTQKSIMCNSLEAAKVIVKLNGYRNYVGPEIHGEYPEYYWHLHPTRNHTGYDSIHIWYYE